MGKFTGHSNSIRNIGLSSDNKMMVTSCEDHSLRIWDYKKMESFAILAGHKDIVVFILLLIICVERRSIFGQSYSCKQFMGLEGHDLEDLSV